MLRDLNNFLKTSDRLLEGVVDSYHNGIIRNHKFSFKAANCHKYGNYFLDASLKYLPSYSGMEGALFFNGLHLVVQSLAKRDMRNCIDLINELLREVNENLIAISNKKSITVFSTQHLKSMINNFYHSKKKNQHNISTLETLFEGLSKLELERFTVKLMDAFWKWFYEIYHLDECDDYINQIHNKYDIDYGRPEKVIYTEDNSFPESLCLLNKFSNFLYRNWIVFFTDEQNIVPVERFDSLMKSCLEELFPSRREQVYSLFSQYIKIILTTIYMINYDEDFFKLYNEVNKVVVFEGCDNLGKSTIINNLIENNEKKFFSFKTYTTELIDDKLPGNPIWRASNEKCYETINNFIYDKKETLGGPILKFHGYSYRAHSGKTDVADVNYVQYFSKYKHLGKNSIYARQFANLYNIIDMTMKSMEDYFTNPRMEKITIWPYVNSNSGHASLIKQTNAERILLQDRSVLSTVVYSLDRYKDTTKMLNSDTNELKISGADNETYLTRIMKNYLCANYTQLGRSSDDVSRLVAESEPDKWIEEPRFEEHSPSIWKPESNVLNDSYHFGVATNKGPLDFLNIYEEMISDDVFIKNSKLHPGCANFINLKFVFFASDSPFGYKEFSEKTKETVTKVIPEFLERFNKRLQNMKLRAEPCDPDEETSDERSNKENILLEISKITDKIKNAATNEQISNYKRYLSKLFNSLDNLVKTKDIGLNKLDIFERKDFWEDSDISVWRKRNEDYKSIQKAYLSLIVAAEHDSEFMDKLSKGVGEPTSFVENTIDDFDIYNPKAMTKSDLELLIGMKIF